MKVRKIRRYQEEFEESVCGNLKEYDFEQAYRKIRHLSEEAPVNFEIYAFMDPQTLELLVLRLKYSINPDGSRQFLGTDELISVDLGTIGQIFTALEVAERVASFINCLLQKEYDADLELESAVKRGSL